MNILVPDSWLREFLRTKATPKQLKEFLSLSGPSIERINRVGDEIVYDIEVTSNRPDSMSVFGIAREASCILPKFGIPATLTRNPYQVNLEPVKKLLTKTGSKKVSITTDPELNPRFTVLIFENIQIKESPKWIKNCLELSGVRSVNNVVDITNYFMHAYGQPAHVFDYDQILPINGVPTMIVRLSQKGEKLTTLDGKTHMLPGNDIVIADGSMRLIDLCGIMGGENTAISPHTRNVVLFLQSYNPVYIRRTAMSLGIRTEAASLFEKGIDSELVMPTMLKGMELIKKLSGGMPASRLYDIYPHHYKPYNVSVTKDKVFDYLGSHIADHEVKQILESLGFKVQVQAKEIQVTVPSFRRDVTIDVDIIEELARIYGYHNIKPTLPGSEPPEIMIDPVLRWEEEIKIRLRDWGYTETYTYSMISDEMMNIFNLNKSEAYKISNPLSEDWVYMRPTLTPSMLMALKQNLHLGNEIKLFELSLIYKFKPNDLPMEESSLVVVWEGDKFLEAKGLAESLFSLFGIQFPILDNASSSHLTWYAAKSLKLGYYGALGVVDRLVLSQLGIKEQVTRLYLNVSKLASDAKPSIKYEPIPKFPPSYEDIAFIVPEHTHVGTLIALLKTVDPLVSDMTLLDVHGSTRTVHVTYLDPRKNLTSEQISVVREKLIAEAEKKFGAKLKTTI